MKTEDLSANSKSSGEDWQDIEESETKIQRSLLCSCCINDYKDHYKKVSMSQQSDKNPFNCIGKLIIYSPNPQDKSDPIKISQGTGFLISNGIVMTTASCITSAPELKKGLPNYSIYFELVESGCIRMFRVSLWIIHEEFLKPKQKNNSQPFDLALLFLEQKQAQMLNRNIKLNFDSIITSKLNTKIITCPSEDSKLYEVHQTRSYERIQLIGKGNFLSSAYSCVGHWDQENIQKFSGSPILKVNQKNKDEEDYQVVAILRNYQSLYWWIAVKVDLNQKNNDMIDLCKFITSISDQKTKNQSSITQEVLKYSDKLLVFLCMNS